MELHEQRTVERIICKKLTTGGPCVLVKWAGYHAQESTWEPLGLVPQAVDDSYMWPPVSSDHLQSAADTFERAIEHCLASRTAIVSVRFSLDIFRNIFGTDECVLISGPQQLERLPLCENWYYKVDRRGNGVQVSFPMRVTPRISMRPVHVRTDNGFKQRHLPVEKLDIVCAIEPYKHIKSQTEEK